MNSKINLLFLLLFFSFACTEEGDDDMPLPEKTWSYAGLGDFSVEEIKITDSEIFAATADGMFKKSINADDTSWIEAGLDNLSVTDFIVFSTNELLASVELSAENPNSTFYKTTDGGQTWTALQTNFGGAEGSQTCHALEVVPGQPDVIYARGGYNVAKSTDRGQSWESVFSEWDQIGYQADLIQVDPHNTDIVWAGGETSIFSPYLVKSTDAGQTWQSLSIPSQGDNAVYSMAIDPANPEHVLVGMEGQIIATEDGGSNWNIMFSPEAYSYIFDIQVSLVDQHKLYAAGTDGGNDLGDIILYTTTDFGSSWNTERHTGTAGKQYAARDMAVFKQNSGNNGTQEIVYIGTNRGVFVYKP